MAVVVMTEGWALWGIIVGAVVAGIGVMKLLGF